MSEPAPMSSPVSALAARPCRLCGGREYVHIPEMFVYRDPGEYTFEVLACGACGHLDLFAPDMKRLLSRVPAHRVVKVP